MIYALIAAIGLVAAGLGLQQVAERCRFFGADALGFFGVISAFAGVFGLAAIGIYAYPWVAAEVKADLINREYGTNYTQAEVFYASDVIDTIRQIQRQRVDASVTIRQESAK